jgi:hypothetical protein
LSHIATWPGLQNVVADFLSCPSLPLGPAGNIAATAAATRIDCEEMAVEQKRWKKIIIKACAETLPISLSPSNKQTSIAWSAMFQQMFFTW